MRQRVAVRFRPMKRALAVAGQFCLFLAVFLAGSLADPFLPVHPRWFVTQVAPETTRYFVPDGLIACLALYLIILAIEAGRKRLRGSGIWTTIALLLAVGLGLAAKFGVVTHDLF